MKNGVLPFQRIKTRVISERTLGSHFVQIDVALQHDFRIGRHFQIIRLASHHLHRFAPQKTREHHLVQIRRDRQHAGKRRRRICANRNSHRYPAFRIRRSCPSKMLRAMFLRLPVHSSRPLVVDLHPVHPHVALPRFWILREYEWKRDKASAVLRPAFQNWKIEKIDVASLLNDFLAGPGFYAPWEERPQFRQLRQHLDLVKEPLRRFHFQEPLNALRNFVQPIHFKRQGHPPHTSKGIEQKWNSRTFWSFEEQRGADAVRLSSLVARDTLRHFCDLEHRVHFRVNALQLPFLLEALHKFPQISVPHCSLPSRRTLSRTSLRSR